jgi:hypothetical protein
MEHHSAAGRSIIAPRRARLRGTAAMRARAGARGLTALVASACAAVACGGGAAPGAGAPPPPGAGPDAGALATCTGPIPPAATMCPGADAGLARDAPRVVTSSCGAGVPCSYSCDAGFVAGVAGCEAAAASAVEMTDGGDGTVAVRRDGSQLVWLRDADCAGALAWSDAARWSDALADGSCGLHDASAAGTWRLPSQVELQRLAADLAAAARQGITTPFIGVQARRYWSGFVPCVDTAGAVDLATGRYSDENMSSIFDVWPVRR